MRDAECETHLLREAPENLLPDDLRRKETLRLVGHDVIAEQRRSFRDVLLQFFGKLRAPGVFFFFACTDAGGLVGSFTTRICTR